MNQSGGHVSEGADDAWIWSQFWRSPRLACCCGLSEDQYGDVIVDLWDAQFERLKDGARILDLCTGNGAVPLMALDYSERAARNFQVTAIDMARIEPAAFLAHRFPKVAQIAFMPGVDAAELPFEAGSFDCVTSQFGLEYADIPAVLAEATRVLSPGGDLVALTHAANSKVHDGTVSELEALDGARPGDVIDLALAQSEAAGSGTSSSPELDEALSRLASGDARQTLGSIAQFIAQTLAAIPHHGVAAVQAKLRELKESVDAHEARLRALDRAALTESDVEAMRAQLAGLGFESTTIRRVGDEQRGDFGWLVIATTPGA